MELKRVVVTGLGALTPVGNTVPEFWNNLLNGVSEQDLLLILMRQVQDSVRLRSKNFNATILSTVRKPVRWTFTLSMPVAAKASGYWCRYWRRKEDLNKIGVIFESESEVFTLSKKKFYEQTKDDLGPKFNPFFIPKMIADIASGQISIIYGFHGPNFTTTSACASSSTL